MAFVQAIEGFFDVSTGVEEFVAAGHILDDADPLVKRHPDSFRPLEARESAPAPAPKPRAAKK